MMFQKSPHAEITATILPVNYSTISIKRKISDEKSVDYSFDN
jgi:hypothetical protein